MLIIRKPFLITFPRIVAPDPPCDFLPRPLRCGETALERGDLEEALAKYSNSYDIRSKLGGKQLGFLAARDLMQIGRIQELQGDVEAALASYLEAREWRLEHFSEPEPTVQEIRELANSYMALGNLYQKFGEPKKAVETFDEITRIFNGATNEASPKLISAYQMQVMPLLYRKGEIQYQSTDLKGAFDTLGDLMVMSDKIQSASPTDLEEARAHYLNAVHFLGQIQLDRGETKKAELLFRDEIKLRQETTRMRPYDPDLKIGLADAYQKTASCLDAEDLTARSLGTFYLQQSLSLIASLPPDIRNAEENIARVESFRAQLDSMLEMDE